MAGCIHHKLFLIIMVHISLIYCTLVVNFTKISTQIVFAKLESLVTSSTSFCVSKCITSSSCRGYAAILAAGDLYRCDLFSNYVMGFTSTAHVYNEKEGADEILCNANLGSCYHFAPTNMVVLLDGANEYCSTYGMEVLELNWGIEFQYIQEMTSTGLAAFRLVKGNQIGSDISVNGSLTDASNWWCNEGEISDDNGENCVGLSTGTTNMCTVDISCTETLEGTSVACEIQVP